MNGDNLILLDTNVSIYLLNNKIKKASVIKGNFFISFITELELLSFSSLQKSEKENIKTFLNNSQIINIDQSIKEKTIYLRKKYNVKLPDAIICGTCLSNNFKLYTNDKNLNNIEELEIITPQLKS